MIHARTREELLTHEGISRIKLHRGVPVQHKDELLFCPTVYMIPANRKDMRTAQQQPAIASKLASIQQDSSGNPETVQVGDALQVAMMSFVTAALLSEALTTAQAKELEQTHRIKDDEERALKREEILASPAYPSDPTVLRFVASDFDRETLLLADWSRIQTAYQTLNYVSAKEELSSFFEPVLE